MALFSFFGSVKPSLVQTGAGGRSRSHSLDKDDVSIGRSRDADIVVDDPYIAPIHARIERQKDGTSVIRRMGLNPIFLHGESILQTATLKAGDSFRLGQDVEFQFVVRSAKETAGKPAAAKTTGTDGAAVRPLMKRPAFLAALGVVYLGLIGGVAIVFLSGGDGDDEAPSAARIKREAAGIAGCLGSAHRMRQISEASFNGAVGGRTVASNGAPAGYAALAAAPAPADEAASVKAAGPIAAEYERITLAALAAETRGDLAGAQRLYGRAFDAVPDINCSAAKFVMERKAATKPVVEE